MLREINEQDFLFPDILLLWCMCVCVSKGLGVYKCVYGIGVCVNISKCVRENTSTECAQ